MTTYFFSLIHLFPSTRVNLPLLLRALYSRRTTVLEESVLLVLCYFITRFLHLLKDNVFTRSCNIFVHKITFGSFCCFFIFMREITQVQAKVIGRMTLFSTLLKTNVAGR